MIFPPLTLTRVESIILPDFGAISHEDSLGRYITRNPYRDGSGVELTLIFEYLSADDVLLLIEHYEGSRETTFGIPLLINYPSKLLKSVISLLGEVIFRYKEAPIIETMQSGVYYSSVTILGVSSDLSAPSSISVLLKAEALLTCKCSSNVVWEQIGGATVDIESPNSLSTIVKSQGGLLTGVDGVLTFKVSLVDASYIFRIVYLFTSPAELINLSKFSTYGEYAREIPPWFLVPLPLTWGYEDLAYDGGSLPVVIPVDSDVAGYFSWNNPQDTSNLSGFIVEYLEGGVWVEEKRVSYPGEVNSCILYNKKPFRITALHSFPGSDDIRATSQLLFIDTVRCSRVIVGTDPITGEDVPAPITSRAFPTDNFFLSLGSKVHYCNEIFTQIDETLLTIPENFDLLPKLYFVSTSYSPGGSVDGSYVYVNVTDVGMRLEEDLALDNFTINKLYISGNLTITVVDVDGNIIG